MSTVLDSDPIVVEALDFSPECRFMTCGADSTWVAHWRCGCVSTYCETHKIVMARESTVLCADPHTSGDNIAPAEWSRL